MLLSIGRSSHRLRPFCTFTTLIKGTSKYVRYTYIYKKLTKSVLEIIPELLGFTKRIFMVRDRTFRCTKLNFLFTTIFGAQYIHYEHKCLPFNNDTIFSVPFQVDGEVTRFYRLMKMRGQYVVICRLIEDSYIELQIYMYIKSLIMERSIANNHGEKCFAQ